TWSRKSGSNVSEFLGAFVELLNNEIHEAVKIVAKRLYLSLQISNSSSMINLGWWLVSQGGQVTKVKLPSSSFINWSV
ncbi:hypothetical protein A2U01_0090119, partial [Trifolium medium]|nr:hypothetical protein [Trifolium medium]